MRAHAGLVVYEEYLSASPRRKIQLGDRVTGSQGLVTIPEVNRMLVEASASEADVHRVRPGQIATVRLEAFPGARLTGKVTRVGTLARSSADRPFDEKRFDLIVELDETDTEIRPGDDGPRRHPARRAAQRAARTDQRGVRPRRRARLVRRSAGPGWRPARCSSGNPSDADVEVVAGLNEGERVSVTDVAGSAPAAAAPARQSEKTIGARSRRSEPWPECASLTRGSAPFFRLRPKRSAATSCARRSACSASCWAWPPSSP